MQTPGLVNLRCNGGHVWMNAEMFVLPHPYYAVTGENGSFQLTSVPPGIYQIFAWHEGWGLAGKEQAYDVLTERSVQRPVFTAAKTWEKSVTVTENCAVLCGQTFNAEPRPRKRVEDTLLPSPSSCGAGNSPTHPR